MFLPKGPNGCTVHYRPIADAPKECPSVPSAPSTPPQHANAPLPAGWTSQANHAQLASSPSPAPLSPLQLLQLLLQRTTLGTTEARLKSVLKGRVNNEIRGHPSAAWLLPSDTTLLDLVKLGEPWLDLVVALVSLAEIWLRQVPFTFPPPWNPLEALRSAIAKVHSEADRLELLVYDPKMKQEDRIQAWRAQLFNFVNPHEFMQILNLSHLNLAEQEPEYQQELFEDFMAKIRTDPRLFTTLCTKAIENKQTVARLDGLLEAYSPSPAPSAAHGIVDFALPNVPWSVATCLAWLRTKSKSLTTEAAAHIEATLNIWHENDLFVDADEAELRDALRASQANHAEAKLIIKHLKDNKII